MGALLRYNYGTHRAGATRLFSGLPPFVNVLYEDSGAFKVATVLADSDSTLQVEAPHGKRAKIKSKDVLLARLPCGASTRSEEHTSELQSPDHLVCLLLLEKKNKQHTYL